MNLTKYFNIPSTAWLRRSSAKFWRSWKKNEQDIKIRVYREIFTSFALRSIILRNWLALITSHRPSDDRIIISFFWTWILSNELTWRISLEEKNWNRLILFSFTFHSKNKANQMNSQEQTIVLVHNHRYSLYMLIDDRFYYFDK